MKLSTLFGRLDDAVEIVKTKRTALDAAAAHQQAVLADAQAATDAAAREYAAAVKTAQDIREQVQTALNESLPTPHPGIVVR